MPASIYYLRTIQDGSAGSSKLRIHTPWKVFPVEKARNIYFTNLNRAKTEIKLENLLQITDTESLSSLSRASSAMLIVYTNAEQRIFT